MTDDLKKRTAASFGFEWTRFPFIFAEYEDNFLNYIAPLTKESFKDKTVLDAGCGAGRHAYFAAKYGAIVTAFDLSPEASAAALRNINTAEDEAELDVEIVQADICDPPAEWIGKFDIILCIGVLHHLPDPEAGFRSLVKLLKPGGTIAIWVYGTADNRIAQRVFEPVRKITTRIPHKALYRASFLGALAVEALNRAKLPLFRHYARFPFRTKWNDTFDVLSAPQSQYYTTCQIQWWFERAGLKRIAVNHRMLEGKAKGVRGMGVKPCAG